jgi:hypothetical protein
VLVRVAIQAMWGHIATLGLRSFLDDSIFLQDLLTTNCSAKEKISE